jgi:hypothetical protein
LLEEKPADANKVIILLPLPRCLAEKKKNSQKRAVGRANTPPKRMLTREPLQDFCTILWILLDLGQSLL